MLRQSLTNLTVQKYAGGGLYAALGIEVYCVLYVSSWVDHQTVEVSSLSYILPKLEGSMSLCFHTTVMKESCFVWTLSTRSRGGG